MEWLYSVVLSITGRMNIGGRMNIAGRMRSHTQHILPLTIAVYIMIHPHYIITLAICIYQSDLNMKWFVPGMHSNSPTLTNDHMTGWWEWLLTYIVVQSSCSHDTPTGLYSVGHGHWIICVIKKQLSEFLYFTTKQTLRVIWLWKTNQVVTFGISRNISFKYWNHCGFLVLDC